MRKIVLLIIAAVISVGAVNARTPIRYQGEVDGGYAIGVGDFPANRVNLHIINGVRIGEHFSTGLGVGVDCFYQDEAELLMPIFLNMKAYLPVGERVRPFFSFDIGGAIGLTEYVSGLSGLLCTPAVGCAFKTGGRGAFLVSLGYNVQQLSDSGISVNYNAVSIRLGYQF